MVIYLIGHGYLFNQIIFINSITPSLFIERIPLCYLNFSPSFTVFNHPGWEIFNFGYHFATQVSLIVNSRFVD